MDVVVTLASVPAILALVNLAKSLGLAGKFSALVALVLGIAFSLTDYLFTAAQQTSPGMYLAVMGGAILGLSASGIYDVAAKVSPPAAEVAYVSDDVLVDEPAPEVVAGTE
jgi:purine-nucleoside phosphorylase